MIGTLNLWLCSGIFLCFAGIGYFIHRKYRQRKQYFDSLVRFCDNLTTEIGFSKSTIAQIIKNYADNYSLQFVQDLLNYKNLLDAREDLTREKLDICVKEKRVIEDFFLELGRHSVGEELAKIQKSRERFEIFRTDATEKLKRDASIYFKICILLGIGVVILLA